MVHHMSWVRTEAEMRRKVSTWGHSGDADLTAKVAEEFRRPFNGTDFIHGYQYDEVPPPVDLSPEDPVVAIDNRKHRWALTPDAVARVDLTPLSRHVADSKSRGFFLDTRFREHYRLLAHLSTRLRGGTIVDVGTYRGYSALALSYGAENHVISYDIADFLELGGDGLSKRIEFCIGDACHDVRLPGADLILLDTTHDGSYEAHFYRHLQRCGFRGLLVLDDIHLNPEMESFWASIAEPKWDATALGHWSGTGLVFFGHDTPFSKSA